MTATRMTDAQWRCLHSFLSTCPDIRVGKEDPYRLFVDAARWMARSGASWRRLPLCPRVRAGRLMAYLHAGQAGAVRGAAGQYGRARA